MSISIKEAYTPATTFRWRDSRGQRHAPADMPTRHLFFTLRMIWNHTMPHSARLPEGNRYSTFGPEYTEAYLKQAVRCLSSELSTRTDMAPDWQRQLDRMLAWLGTAQIASATETRALT